MSEVPRHWRSSSERLRTPQCRQRGKVFSFTKIHNPPAGHEASIEALVKFEDGSMDTVQITDTPIEDIQINSEVEAVTRKLREDGDNDRGIIIYGTKYRLPLK